MLSVSACCLLLELVNTRTKQQPDKVQLPPHTVLEDYFTVDMNVFAQIKRARDKKSCAEITNLCDELNAVLRKCHIGVIHTVRRIH
jgi:hypothetical protein